MAENYETQSIYEGSFLMAKGCQLEGKIKGEKKITLLFKNTPETQAKALSFYNNEKVEAKKLFDCYRTLKDYIFKK